MIAYVNGNYLPHSEATISIDDRALMLGDTVFDCLRTYGGVPFRLEEHLGRLCRSLRYVELDGDRIIEEIRTATDGLLARNEAVIGEQEDVLVDQIVTRGLFDGSSGPTIIVKLRLLRYATYGPLYERGVDLNVSLLGDHFAGVMDRRVKGANRLAATRAELKGARAARSGGSPYTAILNADGSIAETQESNIAIVSGGCLVRPPREEVLDGISLNVLCELAAAAGIEVAERRLHLYDVLNADETILTGTSIAMLPVNSIDGIHLRGERKLYSMLLDAWITFAGFDFVQQAKRRAELA